VTLTLTLDRVEVTLVHIRVGVYPHTKLGRNRKKTLCGRTDGRTHLSSNLGLLGHSSVVDDLKEEIVGRIKFVYQYSPVRKT